MILETVKHDAATIENGVIVFISADNLLCTSFDNQVTSNCSIEVYSEVDEFVGHLELFAKTKSEITPRVLERSLQSSMTRKTLVSWCCPGRLKTAN